MNIPKRMANWFVAATAWMDSKFGGRKVDDKKADGEKKDEAPGFWGSLWNMGVSAVFMVGRAVKSAWNWFTGLFSSKKKEEKAANTDAEVKTEANATVTAAAA